MQFSSMSSTIKMLGHTSVSDVSLEMALRVPTLRNVDISRVGCLLLTANEEAALVAFLKTITDGYR